MGKRGALSKSLHATRHHNRDAAGRVGENCRRIPAIRLPDLPSRNALDFTTVSSQFSSGGAPTFSLTKIKNFIFCAPPCGEC